MHIMHHASLKIQLFRIPTIFENHGFLKIMFLKKKTHVFFFFSYVYCVVYAPKNPKHAFSRVFVRLQHKPVLAWEREARKG